MHGTGRRASGAAGGWPARARVRVCACVAPSDVTASGFGVAVDDGNRRVDHTAKHQPVRRSVGLGRCAVTTRLHRSECLDIL